MGKKYKITIPEPCHEDWNKMTPNSNGRFCISCAKTVIDFTTMLPEEIQHFFIQNQNKNICGRMKKSQLDSITIQIPNQILYSQTHYHKIFLLVLFIVMGTTLFSCSDKNGKKQKIDKIEVVNDITKEEHLTVGAILPPNYNPKNPVQSQLPPPKIDQVKFVKPKTIQCEEVTSKTKTIIEDEIYNGGIGFEIDSEYDGGNEKFYDYFKKEFKLPLDASKKTGEIQISFIIDKNGTLGHFNSIKDFGFGTMDETIRVLKNSKKWKPGEQNGKKTITRNILSLEIQNDSINKIKLNKY